MEADKVKAIFNTDEDGYITGYQQEFWDGSQWQTPFDDEKAILIAPEELKKIAIGASKLADDGTVVIDTDKQAALEKAANQVKPTGEQMLLANLTLEVAQLLSLIHISEPTRLGMISYAVFCLKKKKKRAGLVVTGYTVEQSE